MGEVYRATDTRLGRAVAVKFLPEEFFGDAERVARFEREARLLATLNHPGIATIHSFEEISGRHLLVMEVVEGEDLAERLARGPIPREEALPIARQIAEALEAAHERGIIHRDLKPANVKLASDGKVKILDFGLAKALEADPASGSSPSLTHSPTVTGRGTAVGVILGTAAYMSPEQAKGRAVDRRTDIWAFGCVLYEMLTGQRLFQGEDVSETLASVLRSDPDWNALPAGTPSPIRRLLRRCLERDPRRRLRHIGDATIEIDEALAGPPPEDRAVSVSAAPLPRPAWRHPAALAAGALILAGLSAAAAWLLKPAPIAPRPITRFTLTLPAAQTLSGLTRRAVAISPDGKWLAYIANDSIYVRDLAGGEARQLTAEPAADLAFSQDGECLAKIPVAGGRPQILAAGSTWGASWDDDGSIVFADSRKGIQRIGVEGGTPRMLFAATKLISYYWPQVLPGRAVLYTEASPAMFNQGVTVVQGLDGGERKVVLEKVFGARYSNTGHLVYVSLSRSLMAVPFDLSSRRATGRPVQLPDTVRIAPSGVAQFDISASGTLVSLPGGPDVDHTQLVWVNREGKASPASPTLRAFSDLRLSRDGRRVAAHLQDEDNDVWISDLSRGTMTRLTFEATEDETPVWSPDERSVAYAATRSGPGRGVFRRAADGSTPEELLAVTDQHSHVMEWTPDGRALVVELQDPVAGTDLMLLDLETRKFRPFVQSRFNDRFGRFSPDGKWFAYGSDESGRDEVYVQPFPALDARVQVSSGGGGQPLWSRDGGELFYRTEKNVMAATVTSRAPLAFSPPRALFADRFELPQVGSHVSWDVAGDGRFLMIAPPEGRTVRQAEIRVVLNWFEELRRLAPAGK